MFRVALVAFIAWMVGSSPIAHACIASMPPIEASDVSTILSEADSIEVTELFCDDCSDEQFTKLNFRSLDHQHSWGADGYIVDLPRNAPDENADFFDPWKIWGISQSGCDLVPAVRPEGLYDIAVKNDEIIWIARHDAHLATHLVTNERTPTLSAEYLRDLAIHVYRKADIYWTCDNPIDGRPSMSDASFNPYGVVLPDGIIPMAGVFCLEEYPARGIIHLNEDGRIGWEWGLMNERVKGERLGDDDADEVFSRHLIALLDK